MRAGDGGGWRPGPTGTALLAMICATWAVSAGHAAAQSNVDVGSSPNGMTGYPLSSTTNSQSLTKSQTLPPVASGALDQNQGYADPQANPVNKLPVNQLPGSSTNPAAVEESLNQRITQTQASRSAFARDRNVSVAERPHPDYQPLLVYAGSFVLKPEFDTTLEYSDNIFASQTNRVSDGDIDFKPSLIVESNWSRDALNAFITSDYDQYFSHQSETQGQIDVGGKYRKDLVDNSYVSASLEYADRVEPRSATTFYVDARMPLRYDYGLADVTGVYERDRYRFSLEGTGENYSYHDQVGPDGVPFFLQVNDHVTSTVSAKAEYAYTPAVSFYVAASGNDHAYRVMLPGQVTRDSDGATVGVGSDFDITSLIRGDIEVGYLEQSYRASGVGNSTGPSLLGKLEYFPSQITTLTFTGKRGIEDTSSPDAPAYVTTGGSAQIDHELFRNVVLTAYANHFTDAYQGVDRTDDRWTVSAQAAYLMNNHLVWTLVYRHIDLTSSGAERAPSFDENDVMLTLGFRY